jgi:uncharacterized small protein (DUF1192 family)
MTPESLMIDEDDQPLKHKLPQTFPRKLEGLSIAAMEEYLGDLELERQRVKLEISQRDGLKNAAASLFKKAD